MLNWNKKVKENLPSTTKQRNSRSEVTSVTDFTKQSDVHIGVRSRKQFVARIHTHAVQICCLYNFN